MKEFNKTKYKINSLTIYINDLKFLSAILKCMHISSLHKANKQ